MKKINIRFLSKLVIVFVFALSFTAETAVAQEKMKPEEIIAKHLESIGSAEARAAMKSVTAVGTSKATFFGRGGGVAEGISVVASKGGKYMVAMKFNNPEYQFEKMGYDTENFSVGYVSPGKRSVLGDFLLTNGKTFKRGIMSGALSTSWELLAFDETDARIKYAGLEKIDGKRYYKLDYNPKKGSDLRISLFFDPEVFRHVRTEYRRVISARQGAGGVDSSSRQSETRYKLVEDYYDFKEVNNLTLPHTYKIHMEILSGNGTASYEWLMNFQKFDFNTEIDDKEFKVDSY